MVLEDNQPTPCSMFGTFNLRNDSDLASFKQAFDAFCEHLKMEGYVHSWRLWERAHHEGYDTRFPDTSIILEMCFHDDKASLDCWDYIQGTPDPTRSLHFAVTSQVKDTHFVLCRQIT